MCSVVALTPNNENTTAIMQALKTLVWFFTGLVATIFLIQIWLPSWGLAIALGLTIYFVLTIIVGVFELKKLAINSVPENIRMVATQAALFPELDTQRLEQYTEELQGLGFERLREYSVTSSNGKDVPCFARLFAHPTKHCIAEVGQVFAPNIENAPLACVIFTTFESTDATLKAQFSTSAPPIPSAGSVDNAAQFDDTVWALATSSRELDPILWTLRHPLKLISTHTQESPSRLFEIHLARRDEMTKALGLEVSQDVSFETFEYRVAVSNARLERALRRKNPFLFLYEWKLVAPKHHAWWGEYPRAAKRKR